MKLTVSRTRAVARRRRAHLLGTAAAGIALTCSVLVGAGAAAAVTVPGGPAAAFLFRGVLRGVAATSARNAWAVGCTTYNCYDKTGRPLILHWNGRAWQRQDPAALAHVVGLYGVAATSAGDVWAVGQTPRKTVILHWNGRAWTRVPSPDPFAVSDVLQGVTALSARSAWAVGWGVPTGGGFRELIMHWNGTAWKVVPSPGLDPPTQLNAVAATSARGAWAVGSFEGNNGASGSLILRWNGTRWAKVPSPDPPNRQTGGGFLGVGASGRTAWAVGYGDTGGTLIAGWTGSAWKALPSPSPGGSGWLAGAAVTSARSAWAAGWGATGTLIVRWNGAVWQQVPTPRSGSWDALLAMAAPSAASAWAVGYQCLAHCPDQSQTDAALILHWNGTAWSRIPVSLSP